jgi:hypothetical protein
MSAFFGGITMKTRLFALVFTLLSSSALAGQITYGFKNPAFGDDPAAWSSQAMTIENLEFSRRQAQDAQKKAEADAAKAAAQNTNLSKFMNNLESRIYAQISQNLATAMFAPGAATSGSMNFQGNTIFWQNAGSTINLQVTDTLGNVTSIAVPLGQFTFSNPGAQ